MRVDQMERILSRYRDLSFRIAWKKTGSEDAALEVVGWLYRIGLRDAAKLELEPNQRALIVALTDQALRRWRAHRSLKGNAMLSLDQHSEECGYEVQDHRPSAFDEAEIEDEREALYKLLGKLKPGERVLVTTWIDADASFESAASSLTMATSTYRYQFKGAVYKLRCYADKEAVGWRTPDDFAYGVLGIGVFDA